ncbi:tyrosine--tRNA ligase [Pelagibacterium xiamenense]|uniref:tyrosine--tRNA ligase n=1 Tax=Pelagibacterium xiamenense TaxID=2901140 RepID=UPI001E598FD7|nr:tyrosine--tRNA ligase [Pelagibacterium xiamenense]MCD7061102.1 tyrosine--tRNA ligase [Pelagibacterium xiamenense]
MTDFKSEFLRTLDERGFIHQVSDPEALDKKFASETVTGYIGYDPTAASLHVGHLMQIMMLHWMQKTGHRPIALMGGGTGMIGDPSFKDEARRLLTVEDIASNIEGIKKKFENFLTFGEGPGDAVMANNADWLLGLGYVEFLRDVGRHFSVNRMLSFDSVKLRLDREQSLSFLEFNYMILQAYDFVELNRRYGCTLQMGGSDQWGNIVNGLDLGHRMLDTQFYALTSPLLTTASGQKMGKTANGAVWLNADMLSPYDFWQYWRNTEDADVERFLKLFTTLPLDEITRIVHGDATDINEAKKILATEVTSLVHTPQLAKEAAATATAVFEAGQLDLSLPTIQIGWTALEGGLGILAAAVTAGLAGSNGEARRHIQAGALKVNDAAIDDEKLSLGKGHVLPEGVIKLSIGKKRHVLLKPI